MQPCLHVFCDAHVPPVVGGPLLQLRASCAFGRLPVVSRCRCCDAGRTGVAQPPEIVGLVLITRAPKIYSEGAENGVHQRRYVCSALCVVRRPEDQGHAEYADFVAPFHPVAAAGGDYLQSASQPDPIVRPGSDTMKTATPVYNWSSSSPASSRGWIALDPRF